MKIVLYGYISRSVCSCRNTMELLRNAIVLYVYFIGIFFLMDYNCGLGYAEPLTKKNDTLNKILKSNKSASFESQPNVLDISPGPINRTVCFEDPNGCWPALNNTRPVKDLKINIHVNLNNEEYPFVMTPTWKLPDEYQNIIGFHMNIETLNVEATNCSRRIDHWISHQFHFPQDILADHFQARNTTFRCKDCMAFPIGKFKLRVWSLLKKVEIIKRNDTCDNFVFMDIRQRCLTCIEDRVRLVTVLQNKSCESEIGVQLYQFPSALQHFNIQLHQFPGIDTNPINYTDVCMDPNLNVVTAVFKDVKSGNYLVKVYPEPRQKLDGTLCGCLCNYTSADSADVGQSYCKKNKCHNASRCPSLNTSWELQIIPVNREKDCVVRSVRLPLRTMEKLIIALSVITIIIIIVIIVLSCVYPPIIKYIDIREIADKPKFFIVYADDSGVHRSTVHAFKDFLENNLASEVFIDQNEDFQIKIKENVALAVSNSVAESDRIIIVDSEEVRQFLNEYTIDPSKNGYSVKPKPSNENLKIDNQFLKATLQFIRKEDFHQWQPGKIMIVQFENTPLSPLSNRILSLLGRTYTLPQDIESFVMRCARQKERSWPKKFRPKGMSKSALASYDGTGENLINALRVDYSQQQSDEGSDDDSEDNDNGKIKPPSRTSSFENLDTTGDERQLRNEVTNHNLFIRPETPSSESEQEPLISEKDSGIDSETQSHPPLSAASEIETNELHTSRSCRPTKSSNTVASYNNNNNNSCGCNSSSETCPQSFHDRTGQNFVSYQNDRGQQNVRSERNFRDQGNFEDHPFYTQNFNGQQNVGDELNSNGRIIVNGELNVNDQLNVRGPRSGITRLQSERFRSQSWDEGLDFNSGVPRDDYGSIEIIPPSEHDSDISMSDSVFNIYCQGLNNETNLV